MRRPFRALLTTAVLGWCAAAPAVAGPGPAAGAAPEPVVITYEVRGRGHVSDLEVFAAEAAAVYADPRGWNLGGSLRFERVAAGGDFTLWLTADDRMATFGGACDRVWSCRNGRHVVINEARWLGATDSWHGAEAPLETYRQMVLNHETGHWLGFGHGGCSAPGAPAPVMQQQSISLRGCRPNPWPLLTERAALAARRRVPLIQTGSTAGPSGPGPETTTPTTARPAPPAPSGAANPPGTGTSRPGPEATTPTTARPAPPASPGAANPPAVTGPCARLPRVPLRFWIRCF